MCFYNEGELNLNIMSLKKIYFLIALLFSTLLLVSCGDDTSSIVEEKTFTAGQRKALDSLSGQWSANKVTWSITIVDTVSFDIFEEPTTLKSGGKQQEFHGKMTRKSIQTNAAREDSVITEREEEVIFFFVQPTSRQVCGYKRLSNSKYDNSEAYMYEYEFYNGDSLQLSPVTITQKNVRKLGKVNDSDNE